MEQVTGPVTSESAPFPLFCMAPASEGLASTLEHPAASLEDRQAFVSPEGALGEGTWKLTVMRNGISFPEHYEGKGKVHDGKRSCQFPPSDVEKVPQQSWDPEFKPRSHLKERYQQCFLM
jgi:hypothetical protein